MYHEDVSLSQSPDQNVSDPAQSSFGIFNGTSVESGVDAGIIYQSDAPLDLKVISWAPGVPLGKSRTYAYKSETVGKTDVYIIENGIDGRNRVMNDRAFHHQGEKQC